MMPYAVLGLFIMFLIVTYIVVQGTRAALAWREEAANGNLKVIRELAEGAINGWSAQKRPKPVAAEVWRGIQSLQLAVVAPGYVGVTCTAESEYKQQDGRWIEIRNPLQEGLAITAKAVEMLFYEVPHYQPDTVQVDVYTTYRQEGGATRRECILSTRAGREDARGIDWEEWTPDEILQSMETRYRLNDSGRPLSIDPFEPPEVPEEEEETGDGVPAGARS